MISAANKALFLRNLPTELVREAKAAAARRGQTLTAIVAQALAQSLRVEDPAPDPGDALKRDIAWYQSHRSELVKRYRGEYVAIVDEAVLDHGRDFAALATRVFRRFGNRSVYMPRVQAGETTARIRSPRRTRP